MSDNKNQDTVTFFRKRKEQHKLKERDAKIQSAKAKSSNEKKTRFLRPDHFLKNSLKKAKEVRRLNRIKRHNILPKVPLTGKVYLVIRNKTIGDIPVTVKKAFSELRLSKINTAVFVEATKENMDKIQLISPYVVFGEPNLNSVKSLIYKRGYTEINDKRVVLDNNNLVEEKLGEQGIICIEDLVHEISTVGDNFNIVSNFLAPFSFIIPKNSDKTLKMVNSTVMDRTSEQEKADIINQLVAKMN
ncbi:ribosomal protein L30p/L7e [Neoconidiobolus thromboides FSU 785]|nr:ribosomal protein L30p/L7e [Neoconidiobolus thromboides FSU 785]